MRAGTTMLWLLPLVFVSGAWFLATFRFMHRWGGEEAALAAGLIVAFAIATTLWRWRRSDVERSALAGSRCPRCDRPLHPQHEHARTSVLSADLQVWDCHHCGYRRSEALTCPRCEP